MSRLFTSESVTEGHPDKIADQISDAILDALLAEDPNSRVAVETAVATGLTLIIGEVMTKAYVDIAKVVRDTIREIGYTGVVGGFDADSTAVLVSLNEQSADIALGVDEAYESKREGERGKFGIGAGDQGIIFGYATNETPEYLPPALTYARRLTKKLSEARRSGELSYLRPDGKSQVTVEFGGDGKVKRIDTIVVSAQHSEDVAQEQIHSDVKECIIKDVIPNELLDENTKYFINPTGRFVIGGPQGDSGLTGRKIIVDTYGGTSRHGGGAFSGKDPTKVDRSAAYAARWVAKNLVAAGAAERIEIELAYAIGVAKPVSLAIETFGTSKYSEAELIAAVEKTFDLRPEAIISDLNLRSPIYRQTAAFGHFGRTDIDLPWERLDKAEEIKAALGKYTDIHRKLPFFVDYTASAEC
ncbi:MAG: methionine adenosyltransferase [Clostridiales bacterium]|jgi:S-adenosylmethionine synthetase|nr:methionine adenosyltransferase [Clostridiales bacterium]